jgi:hypothetical protein
MGPTSRPFTMSWACPGGSSVASTGAGATTGGGGAGGGGAGAEWRVHAAESSTAPDATRARAGPVRTRATLIQTAECLLTRFLSY